MKIIPLSVGNLSTNCYLIFAEKEILIIDPGGNAEEIIKETEKTGKNIKKIVLTHYHFDHNQAVRKIKDFSGAEILIHEDDNDFLNAKEIVADYLLKDREEIKINESRLKVIHTPGHTPGSICLLGDSFIITGDTLFKDGYGRTDLPGGSQDQIKKSIEMLDSIIEPGTTVYPGHGKSFKFF